MRKILVTLSMLSLLSLGACGGGKDPFEDDGTAPGGGGPTVPLNATVKGKIVFEGTAPAPRNITTTSDPGCKGAKFVSEDVVVSDGGLENVMLFVSKGHEGKSFTPKTETVTLDQMGCHYIPHALTLQVNQPLKIVNSDETAHNVHAWAMVNAGFNESQPTKGGETVKTFTKEEILFPVKCDVHNWMLAYIGVFNHPLHTVSKTGGAYELKLPAGTYEITAQHEKYGKQTSMVTVAENGSADLNFTFKAN
jgi:plastocyanin